MVIIQRDLLDGEPFRESLKEYVELNKDLIEKMGILDTALESIENVNFYNIPVYSGRFPYEFESVPFSVSASYDLLQDSIFLTFLNYKYEKKGFLRNKECVEELDGDKKKNIFDAFIHEVIHRDVYSVLGEKKDAGFLIEAKKQLIDNYLEEVPTYLWSSYRDPDYSNVLFEKNAGLSHVFTILSLDIPFKEGERLKNSLENSLPRIKEIWGEYRENPSEKKFLELYHQEVDKSKKLLTEYLKGEVQKELMGE